MSSSVKNKYKYVFCPSYLVLYVTLECELLNFLFSIQILYVPLEFNQKISLETTFYSIQSDFLFDLTIILLF